MTSKVHPFYSRNRNILTINNPNKTEGGTIAPKVEIAGFFIDTYYIFFGCGIVLAGVFLLFRTHKLSLSIINRIVIGVVGLGFTFLFGHIFHILAAYPREYYHFERFKELVIYGGFSFYGAVIGAIFGVMLGCKIQKKDWGPVLNAGCPAACICLSLARVGCLFEGCCYGIPATHGIRIPNCPDPVTVPVQIIESVFQLLLFCFIITRENIRKSTLTPNPERTIPQKKTYIYKGNLYIYLIGLSVSRFALDFFRADAVNALLPDRLSLSQHLSIFIVLVLLILYVKKKKEQRHKGPVPIE